jgi:hypothetical protein
LADHAALKLGERAGDPKHQLSGRGARLRYIAGSAWSAKRYMNMRPLYQMQFNNTGAVA